MSSSALAVDSLDPVALPNEPTSLDVWVLCGQTVAITTNNKASDQMVYLSFTAFQQMIQAKFSQDLLPTKEKYNQGLWVQGGFLQFVDIDSTETFVAKQSIDLK